MNEKDSIEITVNGEAYRIASNSAVSDLVNELSLTPQQLAIEFNLDILPKSIWAETRLKPGDKLEIVHFVGGG